MLAKLTRIPCECCCRYHHLDEDPFTLTAADVLPQPIVVRHSGHTTPVLEQGV